MAGHRDFFHLHYNEILISFMEEKGFTEIRKSAQVTPVAEAIGRTQNIQVRWDLACKHSSLLGLTISPPLLELTGPPPLPSYLPERGKRHLAG